MFRYSRWHRLVFETVESRHCLSNVAFAQHDIECCSAAEADFVMAADLDGDGDADVLSASRVDNKIAWYENNDGMATFGQQRIIDVTPFALGSIQLTTTDLDGDGDLDVLAATFFSNREIVWYENVDGKGGFSPKKQIAEEAGLESLTTGDLDGDGDQDIAVTSLLDGGKLFWYPNVDGRGSFGLQQVIDSGIGETFIRIADLDDDGDQDIVSSGSAVTTFWYRNANGMGTFSNAIFISDIGTSSLSIGDLNDDGDLDLVATIDEVGANRIAWLENFEGEFEQFQTISTDVALPTGTTLGDFDGDGDLDVASASSLDNKIAWFANDDGRGNFGSQIVVSEDSQLAASVAAADLDGDGDQDLLSASPGDNKLAWHVNANGLGQFGISKLISSNARSIDSIVATDLDGDGDDDALLTNLDGPTSRVWWQENVDGAGALGPIRIIADEVDNRATASADDLDSDGDFDVLVYSTSTGIITWHRNDGTGVFASMGDISDSTAARYVASDLDGDDDLDVLITSNRGMGWLENLDGQGNFGPERFISTGSFGTPMAQDLDGDQDLDIIVSSPTEKAVWFRNIGRGTFGPEQLIGEEDSVADVTETGDLDGDGDPDVILSRFDDKLSWYENTDGLGSFAFQDLIVDGGNGADVVRAVDLDGDSDLDLVSRGILDGKIVWHENTDGQGRFGKGNVIGRESVLSWDLADLDRDGDIDALFNSGERLAWMEQRVVADVNDDGLFTTSDLVHIFQVGEFEDGISRNSTFGDGDWNGDQEFNTTDLVLAFQSGHFVRTAQHHKPNIGAAVDHLAVDHHLAMRETDDVINRRAPINLGSQYDSFN